MSDTNTTTVDYQVFYTLYDCWLLEMPHGQILALHCSGTRFAKIVAMLREEVENRAAIFAARQWSVNVGNRIENVKELEMACWLKHFKMESI